MTPNQHFPPAGTRLAIAAIVAVLGAAGQHGVAADVMAWTRWESGLVSSKPYANPYADVTVSVTYAGPNGEKIAAYGFWDGGDAFKIRLMFPATGVRTWKTACSDTDNSGLHDRRGSVNVVDYIGENRLYRHGYLKVSDNRRYLTHVSGKPFLWIGDTPWAAFIAATQAEWARYLENRKANKFTVIQVHCGGAWAWIHRETDRDGNSPFLGTRSSLRWNPAYWRQIDEKVRCANDQGLLVYICAVRQPGPGFPVDDTQQVRLFARSLAARMMGSFVVYSPVADDLHSRLADEAGRALDEASPMHLISAHPRFLLEPAIVFHGQDYIDVAGLQSGEGWTHDPYRKDKPKPFSSPLAAQNAIEFPLALYQRTPVKPVINQEGPYDHPPETKPPRVSLPPRKAGYWSFLSGATGHTYGCFGIWNWGLPVRWMPTYDYETALHRPSVTHMKYMSEFFSALHWWTLEPRHDLVRNQAESWMQKMVLAKSSVGDLAVAYLPDNAEITIDMHAFPAPMRAEWFNPTTGVHQTIPGTVPQTRLHTFARPGGWEDALLLLKKTGLESSSPATSGCPIGPADTMSRDSSCRWSPSR